MASSTSSMPMPVLAEHSTASEASRPMTSSICWRDPLGLGGGQVDLVEDRDDLVVVVDGLVDVGQGLGLDALARRRPPGSSPRRRPASGETS